MMKALQGEPSKWETDTLARAMALLESHSDSRLDILSAAQEFAAPTAITSRTPPNAPHDLEIPYQAAELLALDTVVAALLGDGERAAENLIAHARLRGAFAPNLALEQFHSWSETALLQQHLDLLGRVVLGSVVLHADALRALFAEHARPLPHDTPVRIVLAHRAGVLEDISAARLRYRTMGLGMPSRLERLFPTSMAATAIIGDAVGWFSDDREVYFDMTSRTEALARRPPHEAIEGLWASRASIQPRAGDVVLEPYRNSALSEIDYVLGWYRSSALTACAAAVTAVALHHAEHGALPHSLADLHPGILRALPADPYSGRVPEYSPQAADRYAVACNNRRFHVLAKRFGDDGWHLGDIRSVVQLAAAP